MCVCVCVCVCVCAIGHKIISSSTGQQIFFVSARLRSLCCEGGGGCGWSACGGTRHCVAVCTCSMTWMAVTIAVMMNLIWVVSLGSLRVVEWWGMGERPKWPQLSASLQLLLLDDCKVVPESCNYKMARKGNEWPDFSFQLPGSSWEL